MPEVIPDYNKGLSDFHAEHSFVASAIWQIPTRLDRGSVARRHPQRLAGRGIVRMRSGNPVTAFVQTNRSRSLWAPSLGPGTGPDRPSYAPRPQPRGRGHRRPQPLVRSERRSCCRRSARSATVGRNDLIGPDLRTTDLSFAKQIPWARLGQGGNVQLRVEIFNLFNRVNFGPPSLVAFSGTGTETAPLPSFGQIRSTITSARQAQIGVRVVF